MTIRHRNCTLGTSLQAAIVLFVSMLAITGHAQKLTVLHSFSGPPGDGAEPEAGVFLGRNGSLYGTTWVGGTADSGTVFEVGRAGKERVLSDLAGSTGGMPQAVLVSDSKGNLYGTATSGGQYGGGTVFELSKGGKFTVLHAFTGGADGGDPQASGLIRDREGNLYGTTTYGGDPVCGCGVVFKLDAAGNETVLHSFTDSPDGAAPYAGLTRDAAGNLFGTTYFGGSGAKNCGHDSEACGTVFEVSATGEETVLYSFNGTTDGDEPRAGVIRDREGNLYGVGTSDGQYGYGSVYKVDRRGTETVLHAFTGGMDGGLPLGGLTSDSDGNLYGTTYVGGNLHSCGGGCGVVFKIERDGKETVLHSFTLDEGVFPFAGLVRDSAGNLYGTTWEGGAGSCGCGTVFKLTL
jgi:uncharacterized repeat protein (TIGR03803 family)